MDAVPREPRTGGREPLSVPGHSKTRLLQQLQSIHGFESLAHR